MFTKFEDHDCIETSILSIVRPDTITATIIDSVDEKQATELASNGNQRHETSHTESVGAAYDNTDILFKSKRRSRGMRRTLNNIYKLKGYLSQFICQLSSFCLNKYRLKMMQS